MKMKLAGTINDVVQLNREYTKIQGLDTDVTKESMLEMKIKEQKKEGYFTWFVKTYNTEEDEVFRDAG